VNRERQNERHGNWHGFTVDGGGIKTPAAFGRDSFEVEFRVEWFRNANVSEVAAGVDERFDLDVSLNLPPHCAGRI